MNDIKVILYGIGGIGCGILKALNTKKGVKIVGAIDAAPQKIGKDAGAIAGIEPIGVIVVSDPKELSDVEADIVIDAGAPVSERETFEHMKWAIERGINVLVASAETSNMWYTAADVAEDVDEMCKKYGVSYLGMGALQVLERLIVALTEGSTEIESIEVTHHADTTAFTPESKGPEYGISLTREQYDSGVADGTVKSKEELKDSLPYLCGYIGWELDDVVLEKTLGVGEDGLIDSFTGIVKGFVNGKCKMQFIYEMLDDPEHKYFDRISIKGTPALDCTIQYSPDRGLVCTQAALTNAVAKIKDLPAGYINSLSVPACNIILDDYSKSY